MKPLRQSEQDDIFDDLQSFCQQFFVCMNLTAMKRFLMPEDVHFFRKAARLAHAHTGG